MMRWIGEHIKAKRALGAAIVIEAVENRDTATFIPAIAIKVVPANEGQRYLLRRSGYGFGAPQIMRLVYKLLEIWEHLVECGAQLLIISRASAFHHPL
jgi:hypothetical protein